MPILPFKIPPGIYRAGTEYQSRGRWYSASLVRFYSGTVQPVGGWDQMNASAVTGRPCSLFAWRPNVSAVGRWLFIGTESNAYVYDGSATTDVTPGTFTTGAADASSTQGYGAGLYGAGLYGTPRTGTGGITEVDAWHADAWGEYLVATYTADGKLLSWDLNTSNNLATISGAPTDCAGLIVTAERMLMALGAGGDRRKIQWSDTEDYNTWTAAADNTAGDLLLTTDGRIVTGERVRGGNLIHTDVDCHFSAYIGAPFYYNVERVGDNCGIVSASAKVSAASFVAWMSHNGFFVYDGYVKPLPCEVNDYVFSDINRVQISKVAAWHNGEWGEIWWFYPSAGSGENDRYVIWNYRENTWCIGNLARTCGIDKSVWDYPICADASGNWYEHEYGFTNDGAERTSDVFIESGPTEIAEGERLTVVNQCIHDETDGADHLQMTLKTKFTPEGTEYTAGPYDLNAADGYTDVLAQGRAFKVRLEETSSGQWKLGTLRFDVRLGSKK